MPFYVEFIFNSSFMIFINIVLEFFLATLVVFEIIFALHLNLVKFIYSKISFL